MPEISIIIPVFNTEKYLKECLDSILNQTFTDFEIICINDGSSDNSLEILEKYQKKDNRIVIVNQENKGAAIARNKGISLAKGKYIQFLDSDDYFEKTMLEKLYSNAIEFNTDLTICSARKVDEQGNIIESQNPNSPINLNLAPFNKVFSYKDYINDFFNLFNVAIWNKLYSKDLITKNNLLFQDLSSCNDVSFGYISQLLAKKIIIFNEELVNYRFLRQGNISQNRGKHAINIIHGMLKVKKYLKEQKLYNLLKNSFIGAFKKHIAWEIVNCDDDYYKKFLKELDELFPDIREKLEPVLKKDYIDINYLYRFVGNKKVVLWGASLFIKKILEKEKEKNPNILGFVDRNRASWGKMCGNYQIYSPDEINKLKPDAILLTVLSNHEAIWEALKKEIQEKYPNVELMENMFMRKI